MHSYQSPRNAVPSGASSSTENGMGVRPAPNMVHQGDANELLERQETRAARAEVLSNMGSSTRKMPLSTSHNAILWLQRQCGNHCVSTMLQRSNAHPLETSDDDAVEHGIEQARGGGEALDRHTRDSMESAFSSDFSDVRIHADRHADGLAQSLGARAFATRRDVFFRLGEYRPGTSAGRELLAHELTHVVQQNGGAVKCKLEVSEPGDAQEIEADEMARAVMQREIAGPEATNFGLGKDTQQRAVASTSIQRQAAPEAAPATAAAAPTGAASAAPDPNVVWRQIETRATPELLIKLQEIGRRAAADTQNQINATFSPYEDSLESDQTFLQIASIGLGGSANMPQGGGGNPGAAIAGGLAGAAGAGVQVAMTKIMDFKSVGLVKAQATGAIGDEVMAQMTSDSDLYMNFESDALIALRAEFDQSWASLSDEARQVPPATIEATYVSWFQQLARQRYGANSAAGAQALGSVRSTVASALVPVIAKLDDLKSDQQLRRAGAGALGGAATGALIGGALGAGVFSIPGALIGGAIGGVVGGLGGYFW